MLFESVNPTWILLASHHATFLVLCACTYFRASTDFSCLSPRTRGKGTLIASYVNGIQIQKGTDVVGVLSDIFPVWRRTTVDDQSRPFVVSKCAVRKSQNEEEWLEHIEDQVFGVLWKEAREME